MSEDRFVLCQCGKEAHYCQRCHPEQETALPKVANFIFHAVIYILAVVGVEEIFRFLG